VHADDSGGTYGSGMRPRLPPPEPQRGWAFFLDVDGTLLEIAARPDEVVVPPAIVTVLAGLPAVVLVSGRPITQLDRLFAPLHLPAAGLHGLERRTPHGGLVGPTAPSPGLALVRNAMQTFAAAHPGTFVEDKGLALALHYRATPELVDEARRAVRVAVTASGDDRLQVVEGKMVVEVKPDDMDKGRVVEAFLHERAWADRTPVFLGDDVTDEDGFAAVNRLGGHSVRVAGQGDTQARWWLPDVASLHAWLARAVGSI
jgi:trehalose 6-phosphate phosphatase